MITASDRKQLDALIAIVRPAHSLAAKLETLTDEQRARYDRHSECMLAFIARNDIDEDGKRGNAYAMTLRDYGPRLPSPIATALFGDMPKILKTDTEADAARKWMEYLQ